MILTPPPYPATPRRVRLLALSLLAGTSLASPALAQSNWTGANSSDWGNAANWDNGVPNAAVAANIGTTTPNSTEVDNITATTSTLRVGTGLGDGIIEVINGGDLNTAGIELGFNAGLDGRLSVSGAGSTLTSTANVLVGAQGTGWLLVNNGATANTQFLTAGSFAGSAGSITVQGAGATLTNPTALTLGVSGSGTMTVSAGATASNTTATLADQVGSSGQAIVDNATWTSTASLTVGYRGTATMDLLNGATVTSGSGNIGMLGDAQGTVTVDGAGSSWTMAGALQVGNEATGSLNLANGGDVNANTVTLAVAAGESGTTSIAGTGSQLTATGKTVVGNGGAGTMTIAGGGRLVGTDVDAAVNAGSSGGIAISGTGSALQASGAFRLGVGGAGTLSITGGGVLTNGAGTLSNAGSSSASATISGAGSTWTNSDDLLVAYDGTATMTVAADGKVTNSDGLAGYLASASGTIAVDGAGSQWTSSAFKAVGVFGQGGLTVTNGGAASGAMVSVGQNAGSVGTATIAGSGSTLSSTSWLKVGANGTGTLTLTNGGTASAAGVFHIAETAGSIGIVNIGAASGQTAAAPGTLTAGGQLRFGDGAGTLNFNHTGSAYSFAPQITGSMGTINHLAGPTTFTADSWTFGGMTNVTGGRLVVAGRLGGAISVQSGGSVGGTGEVGTLGFGTGGIAAPGNSIGTILVTDVTFNAGSFYDVEVNALNQSDLIIASNTATLNGGTVRVSALPDYTPGNVYNIVYAANGLTGTFAGATTNLAFVMPVLSYDPLNAFVTLIQTANFLGVAQTPNQTAVAGALMSIDPANPIAQSMMGLTADEARQALDNLSGEGHASVRSVLLEDSRMPREAAFDRLEADKEGLWALVQASHVALASDGNAAALGAGGFDIAGGSDTYLGDWLVGLMLHAGTAGLSIPDRSTTGSIGEVGVGLYAGTEWDNTALDLGLDLAWHGISTRRSLGFGRFADTLTGNYGATTGQLFGRLSHDFQLPQFVLRPYGEAAYVVATTGGFTEAGGPAALTVAQGTSSALFTTLGLDFERHLVLEDGSTLMLTAGLGWQHAFADTPTATNALAGTPAFTVAGASQPRDALVLEAGLGLQLESGVRLDLSYDGVLAGSAQTHALKATLAAPL